MRRRQFITLLGGAAAAWPLAARAQGAKLPTLGFIASGTPSSHGGWAAVLVRRLRDLGWIEGQTVAIGLHWAAGRSEIAAEVAVELVRNSVDVIVTTGTPPTLAAKQATSAIPIVFISVPDPVASKLVASLARPGGNVTGLSSQTSELAGKRLELLREVKPGLRSLAMLVNAGNPANALELSDAQAAAGAMGLDVVRLDIRRAEDIAPAFAALDGQADALYILEDLLMLANRAAINDLALAAGLPSMRSFRESVAAGGFMSYGVSNADLYRRAGEFVDKILRGAKPADIPVEQPTKFELIINLKTAKTLGLEIPPTLLARADEVIE